MGGASIYEEALTTLEDLAGGPALLVPVTQGEWAKAMTSRGWERILVKLPNVVQKAVQNQDGSRVALVGHSAGGVMGRLFLSPEPPAASASTASNRSSISNSR